MRSDGAGYRGRSFWSSNYVEDDDASVKFPARRLMGGTYKVFVSYSQSADRSDDVRYTIKSMDGQLKQFVFVNQVDIMC